MSASDIQFFFTMRDQIKIYHWQTHAYGRHKATDEAIQALDNHIDTYVEVYMGKYGRPKFTASTNTLKIRNLNEKTVITFVNTCIGVLKTVLVKHLKSTDTDLFNIRDEMLGELNKLLYLFTLK